jgi:hypothetical protein
MRFTSAMFGGVLAAAAMTATDAHACGFFDYRESRPPVAQVPVAKARVVAPQDRIAAASQRLDEERGDSAASEVVAAFAGIRTATVGGSPLETRAMRILALAVARAGGLLAGVRGFPGGTAANREANLEWAVATLRAVDAFRPNDPVARTDLGEALARLPRYEGEALAILTDLSDRDLIGSSHAYAALARLLGSRGDGPASGRATMRCRTMTKLPDPVCGPAVQAPVSAADRRPPTHV